MHNEDKVLRDAKDFVRRALSSAPGPMPNEAVIKSAALKVVKSMRFLKPPIKD